MTNSPRKGQGEGIKFLMAHVAYKGNGCLNWPMTIDSRGYGTVGFNGKCLRAHRVMCEKVRGKPPTSKHVAAHSCHNRACVNPKHLSWKTNAENQLDRRENGTAKTAPYGKGGRVLTMRQIQTIKSLDGTITRTDLAARYNCSRRTIERACAYTAA